MSSHENRKPKLEDFSQSGIMGIFPRELRASNEDYPFIEFTAFVRTSPDHPPLIQSVFLPMPDGLEFSDGGNYNSIDLGIIAAVGGSDALSTLLGGNIGAAGSGLSKAAGEIYNQIKSLSGGEVGMLAAKALGVGNGVLFAGKKIMSPNTNTAFTGNNTRAFNFAFKLVGRELKDSWEIRNIHNFFRRYTYAAGDDTNNIILSYPPIWTIRFYQNKSENVFFPKMFSCYLENSKSTFNASTNMYRPDGAPVEVDINLIFRETRVLTRGDIDALAAGSDISEENVINGVTSNSIRGVNAASGLALATKTSQVLDGTPILPKMPEPKNPK